MLMRPAICWAALLCLVVTAVKAQSADPEIPPKLLSRIQSRIGQLDRQLTRQTSDYLQKMQRREEKLRRKLSAVDSNAAKQLFATSSQQYAALLQKIQTDTGSRGKPLNGAYMPYADSLKGMLEFLHKDGQFQALQARMQNADEAKAFINQRKQQMGQYISQHTDLQGLLGKQYAGIKQDVYYYSQQLREYKEMWDHPDQLEQQALTLLNKYPAFQTFMKNNSQLAGLFNLPANYGAPAGVAGLQTRAQVAALVQQQVAAGGTGAQAALQSNLQDAQSQLDDYKDKLTRLGHGNGDIDMPDFKPNDQKTKTFWKRLEWGANFQTTHNNYYFPTVTDLGLSLGYRLGHSNTVGAGVSYKIGWGNGIQHIALSSQGVGLRFFLDIKIKGSFSATGGLEYNYTTPFTSYQQLKQLQYWTRSGLIGISKTVSMKSRVFKKTRLQLLWDFLSYQQVPKTQPVLFRVGYQF